MRALSVTDVVLGEAVSGTPEQRYKDMLGIASVISNRASLSGSSLMDVVSAPNQFSAFNRSLPPGASKYRSLAEKALKEIATTGPVHGATYYATPRAKSNLPKGLSQVASTTGHVYFEDPQNRPFRVAGGYATPTAPQKPSIIDTLTAPVREVASTVTDALTSAGSALRTAAFEPVSIQRPSVDVGPAGGLHYDLESAQRSQIPTSGIGEKVHAAASGVIPGIETHLYSGMEPKGLAAIGAKNRHPLGFAGDFNFTGPNGQKVTDPVALQDIAMAMAAQHGANVGYDQRQGVYMGPGQMHIDTMPLDQFPGGAQWGATAKSWADNLDFARQTGIGPTPYTNAPAPSPRPAPNPDPLVAAPLGQIERAPLAPVPSSLMAAPAGVVERGNPAAAQLREPDPERFGPRTATMTAKADRLPQASDPLASLISSASAAPMPNRPNPSMDTMLGKGTVTAPSFASQRMMAPATSLPAQRMTAPAQPAPQPSPAKQASVYQQAAASRAVPGPSAADLARQYAQYRPGTVPAAPTTPANAALMSPSLMGPAQALVPQGPQPLFAPAVPAIKPQVVPQKIAQPVTTPTTSRLKTPQQRIDEAFSLTPPEPKFTASDVYSGKATTGTANDGSTVSRDAFGNISITNSFGATTTTAPDGRQMASSGLSKKSSLSDPLAGALGKMPSGKAIAGSLLGAALGNAIGGPLAGAVGAKLGSKLASGNIAQNSLLSKLMGGYSTTIGGQRMTFANPVSGGPFPNAPDRPIGSDRSYDVSRGRDISPNASREIEAGRGGLY